MKSKELKMTTIYLDEDLRKQIRKKAIDLGTSMTKFVTAACMMELLRCNAEEKRARAKAERQQ